jgi:hypothetical protein
MVYSDIHGGSLLHGGSGLADTWLLRTTVVVTTGDTNCDCTLDSFDIEPFVFAIVDPVGYQSRYPSCDIGSADANGDGTVNVFDIEPFVDLLVAP